MSKVSIFYSIVNNNVYCRIIIFGQAKFVKNKRDERQESGCFLQYLHTISLILI